MMTGTDTSLSGAPLLEARHLSCAFTVTSGLLRRKINAVRAVDDVSLTILPGETLGLVGESGCGKSTLARLLLGLTLPDDGEILYQGQPVPPLSSGVPAPFQMVFQDPFSSLNPRLPVGDSVGEPLLAQHVPNAEIRRRVAGMLEQVGLEQAHASRYPHQFSGGQRQRLAIARALVTSPRFIVCDEAVSALDASVRAQVLNLLRDLQKQHGFACLFISHDLAVVGHMADRIAVMYLGRVVETASRDTLFTNPAHPYTRALLSSAPTMRVGAKNISPLAGEPPSPLSPPSGCAFHPRCPRAMAVCKQKRPALVSLKAGHMAACHFAGQD